MGKSGTLSTSQIACLLIAYVTGSAIVFIPNPLADAAKQDAWLSLFPAYGYGALLLAGILYLHRKHQGTSLIEYCNRLLGRAGTAAAGILMSLLFLFAIPAIVAGIGDFFTSVMMKETPDYVFNTMVFVTAALSARAGILVMARMFLLLLVLMILFSLGVMVLAIPLYKPFFLLPMLPRGVNEMLHGAFIAGGFPFGEVFFFSLILPFATPKEPGRRKQLAGHMQQGLAISGLLLFLSTLCTLLVFGPASGHLKYSLYRLAGEVHIGGTFQRIESVIGIALILGSYMKTSILLFIFNQMLHKLIRLKDERTLVYPTTLVCLLLSLTMFRDPSEFNEQVFVIWPFAVAITGGLLIGLLTVLTWMKGRLGSP